MKSIFEKSYTNYILAILSGLLLALAFPYPSITVLAWVGLIPLLFAVRRASLRQAPLLGLFFGLTFFLIVLYWIQIFGFLAWIALSVMLSMWTALFALGAKLVARNFRAGAQLVLIPSIWALTEYGRAVWPWGFAWANLGLAAVNQEISWIASYVGEVGLSAVIVLANLVLLYAAEFVLARRSATASEAVPGLRPKLAYGITAIIVALIVAELAVPVVRSYELRNAEPSIRVALIQPNIPQDVKIDISNNDEVKKRYFDMTSRAYDVDLDEQNRLKIRRDPEELDLIVWPESVFISFLNDEPEYLSKVSDWLKRENTSLLFGGLEQDRENGAIYNSALYKDFNGKTVGAYRKIHLVPFGEYMPMRSFIERVNDMAELVQDKTPGSRYEVFDFKLLNRAGRDNREKVRNQVWEMGKFSTIICFESADSQLVGKMVRRGARMLFVLTNDGWFGKTAALEQHFQITQMRAIEYGIPVIQAANTGVSGFIDRNGQVIKRSETNKRDILISNMTFPEKPSFYASYGYLLPYLYFAIILGSIILKAKQSLHLRRYPVKRN